MTERKHPLAMCENCTYGDQGGFVPTLNNSPSSGIAVVGEAPGAYEAAYGIPFTGPSGDLLNSVLEHHNIERSEIMITNTVLCRPQANEDPTKAAIAACAPRLAADLARGGVRQILAVGKSAAHSLLDDNKASMKTLRIGPSKPYKNDSNVSVIATWHPAYCLRSPDAFPDFVADVGKLHGVVTHDWVEPDFRVFDDPVTAHRALAQLERRYNRFVIDIESGVEKDTSFVHPSEYPLLCVGLAFEAKKVVVFGENAVNDPGFKTALWRVLSKSKLTAHNGKFDLAGLRYIFGPLKLHFDTMLAAYCLVPGTRILGTDLIWRNIEDLVPGDELVGFNETYTSEMEPTVIKAIKSQQAHTYKITTSKGVITASAGHRWPVRRPDGHHTKITWKTTKELFEEKDFGWRLVHFVDPWEVDTSFEAGYIAGFLDGEGSYGGGYGGNNVNGSRHLQFTQNPGIVLNRVLEIFKSKGFDPKSQGLTKYVENYYISNREAIRAIGMFRPERFMKRSTELWQGMRRFKPVDIINIEYAGVQEVIGLETTSRTFIAEGFLTHNCLDERPGHMALEGLAVENLGCPNWKYDIKQYIPRSGNYANIPRDILYHYNAIDCSNTWDLEDLFRSKMTPEDFQKHDFLVQAAMALIELELAGLTFDTEYNKELHERFNKELAEIEVNMNTIVGHEINPRSVPQVMKYYAGQGLILPTTEADFLKELCDSIEGESLEFTQQLLLHRRRAKLYGTYVKGLANRVSHGKVFTTYLLHGTTSGRLSSRGPNLQNVVREPYIRNQFTAESTDKVLVQLDYKQAEGRVIATLAQDEYLRNIFADESRDLFSELCNDIFGVGLWNKDNRVSMKSIFYGNAYGRGVISITKELNLQGVKISEEEVRKLMKDFNALIPGVMAWQAKVKHQVLSGEDLTTPFGRRRSFWLITDKNRTDVLNEALSFLPQSIASDICVRAMVNVLPRLSGIATMRLTIHDALVFECSKNMVDTATELVRAAMLDSATQYTTFVPFAVDQSVGFRWGEL